MICKILAGYCGFAYQEKKFQYPVPIDKYCGAQQYA